MLNEAVHVGDPGRHMLSADGGEHRAISTLKSLQNTLPPFFFGCAAGLFRDVLKLYDEQNYKKAIKACDGILKKDPKHSETLSMKGICVYNLGRRDEGYALVREGLKCDLK